MKASKRRRVIQFIFLCYLIVVIKVIIFKYPLDTMAEIAASWKKEVIFEGLQSANFTFFKTIKMYIRYSDRLNSFENLVGNVVTFIPFGILFPLCVGYNTRLSFRQRIKKLVGLRTLLTGVLFIFGIELFQLFSAFGAFDVDDILLNSLGVLLGYIIWTVVCGISGRKA